MNFAPTLTIGILAASLYAAECNVTHAEGHSSADISQGYLATALYLFEGSYLDMSNMDKRDPAVVNVSCTDTAWVYRSELDSTMIVIVSEKAVKVARVPYTDDPNAYSDSLYSVHYDDVFKDEFKRLQKAGVYKGTEEQADSLVANAFEKCRVFYSKAFGYGGCEYNPPDVRRRKNGGKDIDQADMPLALAAIVADLNRLLDTLNALDAHILGNLNGIGTPRSYHLTTWTNEETFYCLPVDERCITVKPTKFLNLFFT